MAPPKAILFDIGGVCVLSPFQAIIDYENKHGIPNDWINFAIARSDSNGPWQRLERGEIKMDAEFFKEFNAQLHNKDLWKAYHENFRNGKNKLKHIANPTQLGDHVSLKAESADSEPTDQDRGARSSSTTSSTTSNNHNHPNEIENATQTGDPTSLKAGTSSVSPNKDEGGAKASSSDKKPHKTLKELANPTQLGDPVSLKAETSSNKPTDQDLGARSPTSIPSPSSSVPNASKSSNLPPLPTIDGEALFFSMMDVSRSPDPYIYPALAALRSSQKFILGALSNTVIFPPSHPYSQSQSSAPSGSAAQGMIHQNLRSQFDIFVSSSEVGLRKPYPEIYKLALKQLDEFDKGKGGSGVKAGEVLFLDDIGENLKTAKELGMRTLRVRLGKTWRAVKELEKEAGVELMEEKVRKSKL